MKFKYMLRGFGIGVIFSSVLLAFSFYHKEASLSDAEIMARASELGMVKEEDNTGAVTDKQKLSEQLAQEAAEKKEEASGAGIDTEKKAEEEEKTEKAEEGEKAEKKEMGNTTASGKDERQGISENASEVSKKQTGRTEDADGKELENAWNKTAKEAEEMEKEAGIQKSTARVIRDEDVISIHVKPGMYSSQVTGLLEEKGVVKDGADLDWYLCENNYAPKIQTGDFKFPKDADYEKIAKILTRQ